MSELSYVFEQIDPESVGTTDSKKHFGAGVVVYDPDTDEIRGDYWSDRREDAGLNTAGTIRMTRKRPVSYKTQLFRPQIFRHFLPIF